MFPLPLAPPTLPLARSLPSCGVDKICLLPITYRQQPLWPCRRSSTSASPPRRPQHQQQQQRTGAMQSLVRTGPSLGSQRLCGARLSYSVVAAPAPAPTATRAVTTMAKKKGVRIIVTMECTEARGEGLTPSRYTTQKVRTAAAGGAWRAPHPSGGPRSDSPLCAAARAVWGQ